MKILSQKYFRFRNSLLFVLIKYFLDYVTTSLNSNWFDCDEFRMLQNNWLSKKMHVSLGKSRNMCISYKKTYVLENLKWCSMCICQMMIKFRFVPFVLQKQRKERVCGASNKLRVAVVGLPRTPEMMTATPPQIPAACRDWPARSIIAAAPAHKSINQFCLPFQWDAMRVTAAVQRPDCFYNIKGIV